MSGLRGYDRAATLGGMVHRAVHDTAFTIASVLTERMGWKLNEAEQRAFHELAYRTAKTAIERHDAQRDRERDRVKVPER